MILGTYTTEYWIGALFWGFIGLVIYKLIELSFRSKTKQPLSLSFWLQDNWHELLLGFLIFISFIRFKNDIIYVFRNEAIVVFLQGITDKFFIHLAFGLLFTDNVKRLKKWARNKKK